MTVTKAAASLFSWDFSPIGYCTYDLILDGTILLTGVTEIFLYMDEILHNWKEAPLYNPFSFISEMILFSRANKIKTKMTIFTEKSHNLFILAEVDTSSFSFPLTLGKRIEFTQNTNF